MTRRVDAGASDRAKTLLNALDRLSAPTHALSLWAPWAWAILHARKDIENRSWVPPRGLLGKRFWIQASLWGAKPADMEEEFHSVRCIFHDANIKVPCVTLRDLDAMRGHIVGSARLVRAVETSSSPWFAGPIGWVLEDVRSCQPVRCKGAQGFWRVPDDVLSQLARAA